MRRAKNQESPGLCMQSLIGNTCVALIICGIQLLSFPIRAALPHCIGDTYSDLVFSSSTLAGDIVYLYSTTEKLRNTRQRAHNDVLITPFNCCPPTFGI